MPSPGLKVLELNADFMPLNLVPLSTISWQDAFKKTYEGIAIPISFHEGEFVHTPTQTLQVPSVIVMKDYKHFNKHAKWSKFNVKLRDEFRCQYCDTRFSAKSLTVDHTYRARSHGGKFTWDNSVAACKACNNKKKNEYKMKPIRVPYRPDYFELAQKMARYQGVTDDAWKPYVEFLTKKKEYLKNSS